MKSLIALVLVVSQVVFADSSVEQSVESSAANMCKPLTGEYVDCVASAVSHPDLDVLGAIKKVNLSVVDNKYTLSFFMATSNDQLEESTETFEDNVLVEQVVEDHPEFGVITVQRGLTCNEGGVLEDMQKVSYSKLEGSSTLAVATYENSADGNLAMNVELVLIQPEGYAPMVSQSLQCVRKQ